ncbi:virulence factor BrkB family protein [uncultured Alteromonas sp.]|uniref:virulence factor BrkB family protein n=1 Tax=uncultured Alteromonas sp. TaxID=179113 RepID=UPI0025CD3844|nr:virulence factor BrkB family protein [uncultured Alteromonas sp.]
MSARWEQYKPNLEKFAKTFLTRCKTDNITISAGHLAYVTLLSLVPFIMVFFTILSAFPAFATVRSKLEQFIFSNFVPTASDVVHEYMSDFVGNASQMGAVGILSLLFVAILLISNVDKTLNRIWRTQSERPIIYTFAIYWMVITLGPLLMGASVVMTSYLVGLAEFAEEYTPGLGTFLLELVPSFAALAAFIILYMLVPNRRVPLKHALGGAVLATILFELSKKGFAFYVTSFPSYQVIYGALAALPLLFLWIYLSWIVVLLGAEFTCSLDEAFPEEAEDTPHDNESDLPEG